MSSLTATSQVLAAACIAAAAALLFRAGVLLRTARLSARWPRTTAVVMNVKVEVTPHEDPDEDRHVRVDYEYVVAGERYSRSEMLPAHGYGLSPAQARLLAGRYRPGTAIPIAVDSAQPARATLSPGATHGAWAIAGVAILLCSLSVYLLAG